MDIEEYSDYAVQYYDERLSPLVIPYLKLKGTKTVLDCGCGDGNFLNSMKLKGFLKQRKVYAVDLSKKRIDAVKKIDKSIIAFVDSVEDLGKIKKNSVDLIVSMQVIEHVDDSKMISQLSRVSKKGAHVYIATIFKSGLSIPLFFNNGEWVIDPTHSREYSDEKTLVSLFEKKGFELVEQKKERLKVTIAYPLFVLASKDLRLFEKNTLARNLEKLKVPVPGYHVWELVFKKK
ncbi:MAG: class I SAM-dependent methyltransferase [Nanoarchaeota archaeon]